jgi:hypothetical protein
MMIGCFILILNQFFKLLITYQFREMIIYCIMGYFISFLVAAKDIQTNKVTIKHIYLGEQCKARACLSEGEWRALGSHRRNHLNNSLLEDAIEYVKKNYSNLIDVSDTICGDDECEDESCDCDKSLFFKEAIEVRIQKRAYSCLDPSCDCVTEMCYREPVNIDRTIQKAYKNDRFIISIYYQII